jgi:hypothetical protein
MAEWMYAERPVNSLLSSYEAFPGGSNPQRKECEAAINYDTPFSGYPRRTSLGAGGEDSAVSLLLFTDDGSFPQERAVLVISAGRLESAGASRVRTKHVLYQGYLYLGLAGAIDETFTGCG